MITGGDPFQRPDLLELIAYGKEAGVRVAVSPSGTPTPTAGRLRAVHEAGAAALSLSLDGSTPELHDGFRGVPGVYGWTIDAWDTARELGVKVRINTSVTRHNLHDLPDVVRLVHTHGAMLWSALRFRRPDRAVRGTPAAGGAGAGTGRAGQAHAGPGPAGPGPAGPGPAGPGPAAPGRTR
ncbi:radical SAM protein [Streptomyces anandii]|uniref:radical SAM protein n=1 Tax=Streptomyces anandii TaxID=285454 RepID=UPI00370277D4